jgi:hypothetical protein
MGRDAGVTPQEVFLAARTLVVGAHDSEMEGVRK